MARHHWLSLLQNALRTTRRRSRPAARPEAALESRMLLSGGANLELPSELAECEVVVCPADDTEAVDAEVTTCESDCESEIVDEGQEWTEDSVPVDESGEFFVTVDWVRRDFVGEVLIDEPLIEETVLDEPVLVTCFEGDLGPMIPVCDYPVYLGPPIQVDDSISTDQAEDSTSEEPVVETTTVDETDPNVILYSTSGGGRGTDDNGEIQPNFRGNRRTREQRRAAATQRRSERRDRRASSADLRTVRATNR